MKDPVLIDEFYHQRELDAQCAMDELRDQTLEEFQEEIKGNPFLRDRLALLYAERFESELPDKPFLDWAAHRLLGESEPQWEGGWSK